MSTIPSAETTFGFTGPEGRRSTRIERPVPLVITGHDGLGQEFLERTSAVSLNLHGCRYPSRHDCRVGSWITLQIGEAQQSEIVTTVRAQVRSVQIPRSPRSLPHGVQLEKPENVWRVPAPPPDWLTAAERLAAELPPSKEQTAAATGPGRAPTVEDMPAPPAVATGATATPATNTEVADGNGDHSNDRVHLMDALAGLAPSITVRSPAMPTAKASASPESLTDPGFVSANPETLANTAAYVKPNRVAITPERLLAGLQPKIEKAAEIAILTAVSKHLTPALHAAVNSIDAARSFGKQVANSSAAARRAVAYIEGGCWRGWKIDWMKCVCAGIRAMEGYAGKLCSGSTKNPGAEKKRYIFW